MTPKRPLLRYHGGKWKLYPWIKEYLPPHRIYVEPYGGAGSVLLRKERSYSEVWNDLDGEVVNLFRVLRNPAQARELVRLVRLTPYAREEFELSQIFDGDPVEQARRTLFRFAAGFSSGGATNTNGRGTGFRGNVIRSGSTPAHNWRDFPQALETIITRLRGVVIENRPALDVIQQYDGPDTLHYIDPPYPFETRNERWAGKAYRHEMTDGDHRELASVLRDVAGMVIISGYACALYDCELYPDWFRVTRETHANGAQKRIEVLWINDAARAIDKFPLFQLDNGRSAT